MPPDSGEKCGADIDWIAFHQQFSALYESLNQYNKMTIRYPPMA